MVAGFAFGEVNAFGSWEDHNGHLVVGIDIDGTLTDLQVSRRRGRTPFCRAPPVVGGRD